MSNLPSANRRLVLASFAALGGVGAAAAPAAHAETPRKSIDVTVDGLTCRTSVGDQDYPGQPVPGTSSARVQLSVPTVVANGEEVSVRDLKVALTSNAPGALAARGGFTAFWHTPYAFGAWNNLPAGTRVETPGTYSSTTAISPAASAVFAAPYAAGTSGRKPSGWNWAAPASGTAPMELSLNGFGVYGTLSPPEPGENRTYGSFDCVVPAGTPAALASVPVRDDLPAVTSIWPSTVSTLVPSLITIRGRNFRNVRSIDLGKGGRVSSFRVVSPTQIQALILPFDSGNFRLSVVTPAYSTPQRLLIVKRWF